jgi:NADP-dependent 3-hydroxy acid dehydrogenase YdfG
MLLCIALHQPAVMTFKVIIVTGASKGIGAAIVAWLLGQSHKVVAIARSEAPLKLLKESHPDHVEYLTGDVAEPSVSAVTKHYPTSHLELTKTRRQKGLLPSQ